MTQKPCNFFTMILALILLGSAPGAFAQRRRRQGPARAAGLDGGRLGNWMIGGLENREIARVIIQSTIIQSKIIGSAAKNHANA